MCDKGITEEFNDLEQDERNALLEEQQEELAEDERREKSPLMVGEVELDVAAIHLGKGITSHDWGLTLVDPQGKCCTIHGHFLSFYKSHPQFGMLLEWWHRWGPRRYRFEYAIWYRELTLQRMPLISNRHVGTHHAE